MILPTKQIPPSHCLLGLGSRLLLRLRRPTTLSALWYGAKDNLALGNFEQFLTTISMLYAMGLVDLDNGLLVRKKIADAKKN